MLARFVAGEKPWMPAFAGMTQESGGHSKGVNGGADSCFGLEAGQAFPE